MPWPACARQNTHIPGLEALLRGFGGIVEEVRRKPYDLLDAGQNHFDRDFLEFNVHINELELAVQVGRLPTWACVCLPADAF